MVLAAIQWVVLGGLLTFYFLPARIRIGCIAQAVAEEVEGEDGDDDADTRDEKPGIEAERVNVHGVG